MIDAGRRARRMAPSVYKENVAIPEFVVTPALLTIIVPMAKCAMVAYVLPDVDRILIVQVTLRVYQASAQIHAQSPLHVALTLYARQINIYRFANALQLSLEIPRSHAGEHHLLVTKIKTVLMDLLAMEIHVIRLVEGIFDILFYSFNIILGSYSILF